MAGAGIGRLVVFVAVLGMLASSCVLPDGSTPPLRGVHMAVPATPYPVASAFGVDPVRLDELACAECAAVAGVGGEPDDARFVYGRLPLAATDSLHSGGDVRAELGNMFLSGFFGGLYLRDNLTSIGSGDGESDPMQDTVQDFIGGATLAALDATAGGLVDTARAGSPDAVRLLSSAVAPVMALIYGYNRGYLEVAIENPPPGADTPQPLECTAFFGCRTPALPLDALEGLAPTAAALDSPPDERWTALSDLLYAAGGDAVDGGREVWEGLLGGSDFDPGAYAAIIDLSYGFLEVTEAALLGLAEGAVGDVELGRTGLVAAAALIVWAGSYFLGLASDAPTDALPVLLCDRAVP